MQKQGGERAINSVQGPSEVALDAVDAPLLRSVFETMVERHSAILSRPEQHRLQVLLSVPVRTESGSWRLEQHGYRVDAEYFYPASTVKTAAAVAVLENLRPAESWGEAVTIATPLRFYPQFEQLEPVSADETNLDGGSITIGHEVRKLFLVSDNEAFNRLFELAGRDAVNAAMHRVGLGSFHVVHRLAESRPPLPGRTRTWLVLVSSGTPPLGSGHTIR